MELTFTDFLTNDVLASMFLNEFGLTRKDVLNLRLICKEWNMVVNRCIALGIWKEKVCLILDIADGNYLNLLKKIEWMQSCEQDLFQQVRLTAVCDMRDTQCFRWYYHHTNEVTKKKFSRTCYQRMAIDFEPCKEASSECYTLHALRAFLQAMNSRATTNVKVTSDYFQDLILGDRDTPVFAFIKTLKIDGRVDYWSSIIQAFPLLENVFHPINGNEIKLFNVHGKTDLIRHVKLVGREKKNVWTSVQDLKTVLHKFYVLGNKREYDSHIMDSVLQVLINNRRSLRCLAAPITSIYETLRRGDLRFPFLSKMQFECNNNNNNNLGKPREFDMFQKTYAFRSLSKVVVLALGEAILSSEWQAVKEGSMYDGAVVQRLGGDVTVPTVSVLAFWKIIDNPEDMCVNPRAMHKLAKYFPNVVYLNYCGEDVSVPKFRMFTSCAWAGCWRQLECIHIDIKYYNMTLEAETSLGVLPQQILE